MDEWNPYLKHFCPYSRENSVKYFFAEGVVVCTTIFLFERDSVIAASFRHSRIYFFRKNSQIWSTARCFVVMKDSYLLFYFLGFFSIQTIRFVLMRLYFSFIIITYNVVQVISLYERDKHKTKYNLSWLEHEFALQARCTRSWLFHWELLIFVLGSIHLAFTSSANFLLQTDTWFAFRINFVLVSFAIRLTFKWYCLIAYLDRPLLNSLVYF